MKKNYTATILSATLTLALSLILFAQRPADTATDSPRPPTPMAWWIFSPEDPEGTLSDSMGNFDAEILDPSAVTRLAAQTPSDAPGFALRIDGRAKASRRADTDFVDFPDFIGLIGIPGLLDFPFESVDFTVSAWLRVESFPEDAPAYSAEIPEGEWVHLALTHENGTATLYVNGAPATHSELLDSQTPELLPRWLSSLVASGFDIAIQCDIADVRIYEAALPAPDIETLFLEASEFIEALAADPATEDTAAVHALRALQDEAGRSPRQSGEEDTSKRGGIPLSPNAKPVPASTLFQILTPMEK